MGSPFMTFQCSRVNVCRTASGFERLSKELLSIVDSLELHGLALVAGHQISGVLSGRETWLHSESYASIVALRKGDSDALKKHYWDLLLRSDVWTTATQAYVDLCDTAVKAAIGRRRTVCVFATSCESDLTQAVDRAIVFDFTRKDTDMTQALSLGGS